VSVTGTAEVLAKLKALEGKMTARLVEAVDRTCVDVANAAKRDHGQAHDERYIGGTAARQGRYFKADAGSHTRGRYENQTGNLTQSIIPVPATVTVDAIIGTTWTDPSTGDKALEYAGYVERRYPFLFPALKGAEEQFIKRVEKAMAV
jgi:hypothetical protein